jgi:hypothetical protein
VALLSGNSPFLGVRRLTDHGAITGLVMIRNRANFGHETAGQRPYLR